MEKVRVGISIRVPELHFRFTGETRVFSPGRDPYIIPAGEYSAKIAASSSQPLWGAKVATFINRERAEQTAEFLRERGVEVELLTMGGEVEWGDAGELDTTVTAVVIGRSENADAVLEAARAQLMEIPAEDSRIIAGLRRYEDEIPRLKAVRLNPPEGGQILIQREGGTVCTTVSSPLICRPNDPSKLFELANVTIGIQFHWQHDETLAFRGALEIVADGDKLTAVNEVDLDDYLASLLGSEMRSDWPPEALAAQAIAARSTVLATRNRHHYGEAFQLCHDDHCQCYQGVSRESETSRSVLESVRGQILSHDGRVADARYAKTSGVLTDSHEIAWDDEIIPYLTPVPCGPSESGYLDEVDKVMARSGEENLRDWLANPPEWAACNPASHPYPPSAEEMKDLFIWREELSWDRVTELVKLRTGMDIGNISHLEPLERGISGRIVYLRVHGLKGTVTIGKELTIRRLLSDSHLPSSAFLVSEVDEGIVLDGLGWGHGVGLCQLGACGLAAKGWDRARILSLFYSGATLQSG